MLKLMYITNDPVIAKLIEKCGVDRVFIDLEYLGKEERQKGLDTVKSKHSEDDVLKVSEVLSSSELLVRVNPINEDSEREIDSVIKNGADRIMLPMFKTAEEVRVFLNLVDGRVPTVLLLEHIDAVNNLDSILEVEGIDEIHIGLNDLHLSMGLTFMFELLSNGVVESITNKIKEKGIPFGIGGISRIGGGTLPAEIIIAEHYRLGSSAAILSRSFCSISDADDIVEIEKAFSVGIREIRDYENKLPEYPETFFVNNISAMSEKVDLIVQSIKGTEE